MTMIDAILADAPEFPGALCAQTDPDAFFPDKGGSSRDAKAICWRCEHRPDCFLMSLERKERFGIMGGVSERDRRAMIKQLAAGVTPPAVRQAHAEIAARDHETTVAA